MNKNLNNEISSYYKDIKNITDIVPTDFLEEARNYYYCEHFKFNKSTCENVKTESKINLSSKNEENKDKQKTFDVFSDKLYNLNCQLNNNLKQSYYLPYIIYKPVHNITIFEYTAYKSIVENINYFIKKEQSSWSNYTNYVVSLYINNKNLFIAKSNYFNNFCTLKYLSFNFMFNLAYNIIDKSVINSLIIENKNDNVLYNKIIQKYLNNSDSLNSILNNIDSNKVPFFNISYNQVSTEIDSLYSQFHIFDIYRHKVIERIVGNLYVTINDKYKMIKLYIYLALINPVNLNITDVTGNIIDCINIDDLLNNKNSNLLLFIINNNINNNSISNEIDIENNNKKINPNLVNTYSIISISEKNYINELINNNSTNTGNESNIVNQNNNFTKYFNKYFNYKTYAIIKLLLYCDYTTMCNNIILNLNNLDSFDIEDTENNVLKIKDIISFKDKDKSLKYSIHNSNKYLQPFFKVINVDIRRETNDEKYLRIEKNQKILNAKTKLSNSNVIKSNKNSSTLCTNSNTDSINNNKLMYYYNPGNLIIDDYLPNFFKYISSIFQTILDNYITDFNFNNSDIKYIWNKIYPHCKTNRYIEYNEYHNNKNKKLTCNNQIKDDFSDNILYPTINLNYIKSIQDYNYKQAEIFSLNKDYTENNAVNSDIHKQSKLIKSAVNNTAANNFAKKNNKLKDNSNNNNIDNKLLNTLNDQPDVFLVKLLYMGQYRIIPVDYYFLTNRFNQWVMPTTNKEELWPSIITKAIIILFRDRLSLIDNNFLNKSSIYNDSFIFYVLTGYIPITIKKEQLLNNNITKKNKFKNDINEEVNSNSKTLIAIKSLDSNKENQYITNKLNGYTNNASSIFELYKNNIIEKRSLIQHFFIKQHNNISFSYLSTNKNSFYLANLNNKKGFKKFDSIIENYCYKDNNFERIENVNQTNIRSNSVKPLPIKPRSYVNNSNNFKSVNSNSSIIVDYSKIASSSYDVNNKKYIQNNKHFNNSVNKFVYYEKDTNKEFSIFDKYSSFEEINNNLFSFNFNNNFFKLYNNKLYSISNDIKFSLITKEENYNINLDKKYVNSQTKLSSLNVSKNSDDCLNIIDISLNKSKNLICNNIISNIYYSIDDIFDNKSFNLDRLKRIDLLFVNNKVENFKKDYKKLTKKEKIEYIDLLINIKKENKLKKQKLIHNLSNNNNKPTNLIKIINKIMYKICLQNKMYICANFKSFNKSNVSLNNFSNNANISNSNLTKFKKNSIYENILTRKDLTIDDIFRNLIDLYYKKAINYNINVILYNYNYKQYLLNKVINNSISIKNNNIEIANDMSMHKSLSVEQINQAIYCLKHNLTFPNINYLSKIYSTETSNNNTTTTISLKEFLNLINYSKYENLKNIDINNLQLYLNSENNNEYIDEKTPGFWFDFNYIYNFDTFYYLINLENYKSYISIYKFQRNDQSVYDINNNSWILLNLENCNNNDTDINDYNCLKYYDSNYMDNNTIKDNILTNSIIIVFETIPRFKNCLESNLTNEYNCLFLSIYKIMNNNLKYIDTIKINSSNNFIFYEKLEIEYMYCIQLSGNYMWEYNLSIYSDTSALNTKSNKNINDINHMNLLKENEIFTKYLGYNILSFLIHHSDIYENTPYTIKKLRIDTYDTNLLDNNTFMPYLLKIKINLSSEYSKYYCINVSYKFKNNKNIENTTLNFDLYHMILITEDIEDIIINISIKSSFKLNSEYNIVCDILFKTFKFIDANINNNLNFNNTSFISVTSVEDIKTFNNLEIIHYLNNKHQFNITDVSLVMPYDIIDFYKEHDTNVIFDDYIYLPFSYNNKIDIQKVYTSLYLTLSREQQLVNFDTENITSKSKTKNKSINDIKNKYTIKNYEVIKSEILNEENIIIANSNTKKHSNLFRNKHLEASNINLPSKLEDILFTLEINSITNSEKINILKRKFYKNTFIENFTFINNNLIEETKNNNELIDNDNNFSTNKTNSFIKNKYQIKCYFDEKIKINHIKWKLSVYSSDCLFMVKNIDVKKFNDNMILNWEKELIKNHKNKLPASKFNNNNNNNNECNNKSRLEAGNDSRTAHLLKEKIINTGNASLEEKMFIKLQNTTNVIKCYNNIKQTSSKNTAVKEDYNSDFSNTYNKINDFKRFKKIKLNDYNYKNKHIRKFVNYAQDKKIKIESTLLHIDDKTNLNHSLLSKNIYTKNNFNNSYLLHKTNSLETNDVILNNAYSIIKRNKYDIAQKFIKKRYKIRSFLNDDIKDMSNNKSNSKEFKLPKSVNLNNSNKDFNNATTLSYNINNRQLNNINNTQLDDLLSNIKIVKRNELTRNFVKDALLKKCKAFNNDNINQFNSLIDNFKNYNFNLKRQEKIINKDNSIRKLNNLDKEYLRNLNNENNLTFIKSIYSNKLFPTIYKNDRDIINKQKVISVKISKMFEEFNSKLLYNEINSINWDNLLSDYNTLKQLIHTLDNNYNEIDLLENYNNTNNIYINKLNELHNKISEIKKNIVFNQAKTASNKNIKLLIPKIKNEYETYNWKYKDVVFKHLNI